MSMNKYIILGLGLMALVLGERIALSNEPDDWDGKIVRHGTMHEPIGLQQHQGRVQLKSLVDRPHFYGVGALANLEGEITLFDGKATITRVGADGQLNPSDSGKFDESATLLVGAYIPSWTEHKTTKNVAPDEVDKYLADAAAKAGLDVTKPFVFTVQGEFSEVQLHVINGACPLHSRLKKIVIPKEMQPFEAELEKVEGTVVGVFAKDAVGKITHPATSTHMHLVFQDATTGKIVTGHVEQLGLIEGAVVRLSKSK